MRIAVAGLQHETNTFLPSVTTLADFERGSIYGPLRRGPEVLSFLETGNPVPMTGFLQACQSYRWTALPALWCFGEPGALVAADAFHRLAEDIISRFEAMRPFDAIYLDLHGALVVEGKDDGEGALLARLRDHFGEGMPIAASLDLHGNVTEQMVAAASFLVAYRTYPHIDMRETGARAAAGLRLLTEKGPMEKFHRKLPFLVPIHRQTTLTSPMRELYGMLAHTESREGALESLSFLPGFPLSDIAECGPSILAYGYDTDVVLSAGMAMVDAISAQESAFLVDLPDADEAVRRAIAWSGQRPALIADVQDNAGGGGTSDTMWLVRALLAQDAQDAAVGMVFDAETAKAAASAGVGATITVSLGGKLFSGDRPVESEFEVKAVSTGPFRLSGPMAGGAMADLGTMAVLRHGGVEIIVVSDRTQCHDLEFFRRVGIEPAQRAILVVKSTNHYRAAFQPIAGTIIEAGCPGACVMDPTTVPYNALRPGVRLGRGKTS